MTESIFIYKISLFFRTTDSKFFTPHCVALIIVKAGSLEFSIMSIYSSDASTTSRIFFHSHIYRNFGHIYNMNNLGKDKDVR